MLAVDIDSMKIADYLHVKGVKLVEPGMPQWKIKPLREKNHQLINEYLENEAEKQREEEKWAAIPEWKRPLLREREKKKRELEETQKEIEEAERREREKFESLPEWKRKVLTKKKSLSSDHDTNSDTKSETSGSGQSEGTNNEQSLLIQETINKEHSETTTTAEYDSDTNKNFKIDSNGESNAPSESAVDTETAQN